MKNDVCFLVESDGYDPKRIKEIFSEVHPELKIVSISKYRVTRKTKKILNPASLF